MGIETAIIIAAIASTAVGVTTAVQSSQASKKASARQQDVASKRQSEINAQKAADERAASDAERIANQRVSRTRRLSLISTSPQGAQGGANVGRSKLFGN